MWIQKALIPTIEKALRCDDLKPEAFLIRILDLEQVEVIRNQDLMVVCPREPILPLSLHKCHGPQRVRVTILRSPQDGLLR